MLLVVDVGNTNTVFAIYKASTILGQWRCSTDTNRTADEYFIWLKGLTDYNKINLKIVQDMIISAVVPQVEFNLRVMSNRYFDTRPLVVGKPDCRIPIEIRVDKGVQVGADRIVNSVGAFNKYGGDLVVIDFGTATTFDIIDYDGAYIGGVISPGVDLSLSTLYRSAAALPYVNISRPKNIIGKNTRHCMQSGIFWGYVSLIEGIIKRINSETGKTLKTIATGGLSTLFGNDINIFEKVDLNLTLSGLVDIYKFNKKESDNEQ